LKERVELRKRFRICRRSGDHQVGNCHVNGQHSSSLFYHVSIYL